MDDVLRTPPDMELLKRQAAWHAARLVQPGMVIGLGTGSTAQHLIAALGARVAAGLHITAVATSDASATQAAALGITVRTLDDVEGLDLTIDGADEIDLATFGLIKGRGGALLREKIVARASALEIIIADESKLVSHLGQHAPVPVEVVPFGWRHTAAALQALGCAPTLRLAATGDGPFHTDGGHYILDCACGPIADPAALEQALKAITGVVESGLFLGLAGQVIMASADGVRVYRRPGDTGHLLGDE